MPEGENAEQPAASEHWHPLIKDLYKSLAKSGQSAFYEPSDWQFARIQCEFLSTELKKGGGANGQIVAVAMAGLSDLLVAEGHRRRLRLELKKGGEPVENQRERNVVSISRNRLTATG